MFWRRRAQKSPTPSLGFCGKLPEFGDFVRHRAVFPEVEQLDQWFQSGLHLLERQSSEEARDDYAQAPPVRFLFHSVAAKADHALVGVFGPSHDKAGRQFPFAIFARLPWSGKADATRGIPERSSAFLDQAEAFIETAAKLTATADLLEQLDHLPVPEVDAQPQSETYETFLRQTRTDQFLADTLLEPGQVRRALHRLYSVLAALGRSKGQTQAQFRYPLGPKEPLFHAAFWIDLTLRLLGRESSPAAFWTPRADRPYLLLALGRPTGKTFLHLLRDDVEDDTLCDLAAPGEDPPAGQGVGPMAEEPPLSLDEVLARAG